MKSVVELEIDVPQARLAELFADPAHFTKWMDDVEGYEPISGEPGMPGSTFRLVPRRGKMAFDAKVIARDLPADFRLCLDASSVTVYVTGTLVALSPERTRLISEEVFRFKGVLHKLFGLLAWRSIEREHRRQMEAFKRFAEAEG